MARVGLQAPASNGNLKAAKRERPSYKETSDSEDDMPLKDKILPQRAAAKQGSKRKPESKFDPGHNKKPRKSAPPAAKSSRAKAADGEKRWTKLHHSGVLFPPEYEVHGVKMLYEGKPVDLTPEQEEVATMFAVMKETDYVKKEQFLRNFWDAFKPILGKGHVIKDLKKCDFTPIYEHHMAGRDLLKALSKEVCTCPMRSMIINILESASQVKAAMMSPVLDHCKTWSTSTGSSSRKLACCRRASGRNCVCVPAPKINLQALLLGLQTRPCLKASLKHGRHSRADCSSLQRAPRAKPCSKNVYNI